MLEQIIESLVSEIRSDVPEIQSNNFQFPAKFGDISCNIAFILSKSLKKRPEDIARELAPKFEKRAPDCIKKIDTKGGYINFYLDYSKLFTEIVGPEVQKKDAQKIMVEFSNPNPCKAMHIGTARTTFLGDSMSEILRFRGNEVIRANYYNNLGKQFAKVIFAADRYGFPEGKKPDHGLAEIYVKLHKELNEKPNLNAEIQKVLERLECKDPALTHTREKVLELATEGFDNTYSNLGIKFDIYFYESDFREEGKKLATEVKERRRAFVSDEGTLVADLEKFDMPNTVLLRSDGTGLYITSDLALAKHRFEKYGLDKCIWVVGSDQNLYFRQLFKIFDILDFPFTDKCTHMSYGMVTLKGSKMSSRAGEFILLDELADEVVEKAGEEVIERHPELELNEVRSLAQKIGIGALKYDILKVDRNKGVDFNPKQAIQFDGNTGPYIQYMIVRCGAILRKLQESVGGQEVATFRPKEQETALMRKFLEFEGVVERAARDLKPNLICNYAFELATLFSQFYEHCKVVGSSEEEYRRKLVEKTKELLETCLGLLRIEVPERM